MNTLIIAVIIGLVSGVLGGLLGIGGGIVIVPALVIIFGYSQHLAQGTTLATLVLPIGLLATYQYYKKGFVNIPVALCIAVAFFIGSFFGAKFSTLVNDQILKKIFAVLLLIIAVKFFFSK